MSNIGVPLEQVKEELMKDEEFAKEYENIRKENQERGNISK